MIPYGRQHIDQQDIDAIVEVLRSDFLTQGPVVDRFEQTVADYCGVPHAVAVNSATSALHLAYLALGVGHGDEVWTVPNTFVATANAALHCGAQVDFVDIDPVYWNMDVDALEAKLKAAHAKNRLPRVVVPVHFAGMPCDMPRIHALSQEFGFRIVEDASHAIGARIGDTRIGNCHHSDLCVFSFHPVKIITTGEGGMILGGDEELDLRMRELRSHGVTRDPARMQGNNAGGWYYEQTALGFNFRLTDIQAALGCSQMNKIEKFLSRRRALADRYDELLSECDIDLPARDTVRQSAWHLYVAQVPERNLVYESMRAAGIGVNVHYIPVHLQPYYRERGFCEGDCPVAEAYYRQALTLPLHPGMTDSEQAAVASGLQAALRVVRR